MARRPPKAVLVAIVGGSGSGKTWLAQRLERQLAPQALRLAQDDFYHDRSHLSPARRARLNFDHPRAIDWARLQRVVRSLRNGRKASVPRYDFTTHSRQARERVLRPKPIVLLEGLWLLRRAALRSLFALRIFLDCPGPTRLQRRLARDSRSRGRTRASIRQQFRQTVEPMHQRFVAPQAAAADIRLTRDCTHRQVRALARRVRQFLQDCEQRPSVKGRKPLGQIWPELGQVLKRTPAPRRPLKNPN